MCTYENMAEAKVSLCSNANETKLKALEEHQKIIDRAPFYHMKIDDSNCLNNIEGRQTCGKCCKSRKFFCYSCYLPVIDEKYIPQIKLPIKIDIIKHIQEIDGKSTAIHAAILAPEDVKIYTYPNFPEFSKTEKTVLIFPSMTATSVNDLFILKKQKDKTNNEIMKNELPITRAVFIDSTWHQTKSIYKDRRLQDLPCVILKSRISQFWRHQKKSPRWYLATIEAIHQFLVELHTCAFGEVKDYSEIKEKVTSSDIKTIINESDLCQPYNGQYNVKTIMENSQSDISSLQSNSEIKFLQQVKECQDHLHHMEKLFFELQKKPEPEKKTMKIHKMRNDFDQSHTKYKLNENSLLNFQLLMQNSETESNLKNNLFAENCSTRIENDVPIHPRLDSINNDRLSHLTFFVQVPKSILNYLKKKVCNNYSIDTSTQNEIKRLLKSSRKTRSTSFLQKLFKKKKNVLSSTDINVTQNTEILQLLKEKNKNNFINFHQNSNNNNKKYASVETNIYKTENSTVNENSTNTEIYSDSSNRKEKETLIFAITYNFDEKSCIKVKSNLTIHHEIIPQTDKNLWSHCIKIINEIPSDCLNSENTTQTENEQKEKELLKSKEKELQSSKTLLENLVNTLCKTAEKLNNLDELKLILKNLNEKKICPKTFKQTNKTVKMKKNKNAQVLNLLLRHVMINTENKINNSKSLKKNIPKKYSSKVSVCSSFGSISSDEEVCRGPVILKSKRSKYKMPSSSVLNYFICKSKTDVDERI